MDSKLQNALSSAMEKGSSIAFSDIEEDYILKRSFMAKIILAEEKIKNFYTEIFEQLFSYERIRKSVSWSGVSFYVGKTKIACVTLTGKTLRLFLALDIDSVAVGKYKLKDAEAKKFNKTPACLKIKSDGAKRFALKLIQELAKKFSLKPKKEFSATDFSQIYKSATIQDLIESGLIKKVKKSFISGDEDLAKDDETQELKDETVGEKEDKADDKEIIEKTAENNQEVAKDEQILDEKSDSYSFAHTTINSLFLKNDVYKKILALLSEGVGKINISQKTMLRSVDEMWVTAIEDCVTCLDELIRNPNHYIAETEEVLPIERTKRISGRSVAHLCRHTDYISIDEHNEVKPLKMLNVFREDSILTYENKFLNTLINRLYMFVNRRYSIAKNYGADEKIESFEFENNFTLGDNKGKIKISVEYSEKNYDKDTKKSVLSDGLWKRVERLNDIVSGYIESPFVKTMGRNFIRPPVMRTNAIVKNKYFRECLALWEFIESYDDAGYGIVIDQKTIKPTDEYVKDAYFLATLQFLLFKYNLKYGFSEEETETDNVQPTFKVEKTKAEKYSETTVFKENDNGVYGDLALALAVALDADERKESFTSLNIFDIPYKKTFHAKIRLADDELKEHFVDICNEFLKFKGVKMRQSKAHASFYKGRKALGKINIIGKTVKLFLALNQEEMPEKYHLLNDSDKKQYEDVPTLLRVKSKRSVKYAKELINIIAQQNALKINEKVGQKVDISDYATQSFSDMVAKGWIIFISKKGKQEKEFGGDNVYIGGKAFGSEKSEHSEIIAKQAEQLSVSENSSILQDIKVESQQEKTQTATIGEENTHDLIKNLVRPDNSYEKPTDYGLDDSSEFMKDENETTYQTNPSNNKRKQ